ncbi:DEAD/DEAH box helicase [Bacillus cereus]|uniref:DEAD/DEAH box helicase n=1 Tax=Bacillus cereus TaxID=1396 RepID=A0A9X7GXB4_BACCE|nr:DEAD/DEAH box helicase family protein [Bacillus cereus]PGS81655.1 DEAD/DEAH box helicase [Bacillus cereus]
MKLRDYQEELFFEIKQSILKGHRSIIVQSPPRSGKTVVMAHIAKGGTEKKNHVLFFSHRKEINEQVIKTFEVNGVDSHYLTIGSVQSLVRKIESLPKPTIILVDEAHHIKAGSYKKIIESFPDAYKLFFTGTPTRLNGQGFEDMADALIIGKSIKWLQEHGNIAPFKYYAPNIIDTDQLKRHGGDFTQKSIDESFKKAIYGDVINHYEKLAKNTQAICYAHNVATAERVAKEFHKAGYTAEVVHGKTPKKQRTEIMDLFRNGKIKILVNVELFTEGVDLPDVTTCIMLRPTQSLSLFLQFAMRPLNPKPNKTAILIDHVGNYTRHGLPNEDREWTLQGISKTRTTYNVGGELIIKQCEQCFGCFDSSEYKSCPYCGHEPELTERELENIKDIELQEITEAKVQELKTRVSTYVTPDMCENVDELVEYKNQHGLKSGWVYYQQKLRGWL